MTTYSPEVLKRRMDKVVRDYGWYLYQGWMGCEWSETALKEEHKHKPLRLGICCSYYNDARGLERLIKSMNPLPNFRQIPWASVVFIGIDGRYEGFDVFKDTNIRPSAYSTDGSNRVIEWFTDSQRIINVRMIGVWKPHPEREKRQKYLDIAAEEKCDFVIIVDADEYFEPRIKWRRLFQELDYIRRYEADKGNVYSIRCLDLDNDGFGNQHVGPRPRLWFRPELMEYTDKHYHFKRKDSNSLASGDTVRAIPEDIIQIYHNPSDCRTKTRLQKQRDYESRLVSLEDGLQPH